MSIVANNSFRFNMSLDFWLLRDYTTKDLLSNWNGIIDFARNNESEENANFLADCIDILYEKVLSFPVEERGKILDKANTDVKTYEKQHKVGVA